MGRESCRFSVIIPSINWGSISDKLITSMLTISVKGFSGKINIRYANAVYGRQQQDCGDLKLVRGFDLYLGLS